MNDLSFGVTQPSCAPALPGLLHAPPEFIELLPVAAYACDAHGRVLWFNRRAAQLWGRAPRVGDDSELFCGSYRLVFDGEEISRAQTPMAQVLRTGEAIEGAEGVVVRPDGSRVWAMVHITPVKDALGNVVGAINCFHNTDELHRVSEAVQEKQEELEDFFENGAMAMHIVSADGIIQRANGAELALLGYEPEEYIGQHIADFHADQETISSILSCLNSGQKFERRPARLKAKDGSIKHVLITSSPRFKDGRFLNTRCFSQDATAEILAKQSAADSEERYRQLLEALPAAVYTTDVDGRITYFNDAAVQLAGRTPVLGEDQWCVTWRLRTAEGEPLPHHECPMAIALKENRPVRNVEALAERPDGRLVPFLPYPTPLRDRDGRLVGAVNMLVDISERKEAENRQMMLLRELNHRVKNNMHMLRALLHAAERETSNAEARAVLADATRRVAAMAAAQQVLHEEGAPTTYEAEDFLRAVCDASRVAFDRRVSVAIEAASGSLPNDTAMPLALILNELLTNAAKHGANGSASATIRVGFAREDTQYRLWVADDGPGFDLEASRKRSSGLGLVNGLARQLGGTFTVSRAPGARCTIAFEHRAAPLQ
jgi:PAS domain S-box-containing protein